MKSETVIACVGFVCVTAVTITGLIIGAKKQKERQKKFDEAKETFTTTHKIDEMVDNASVANEKIDDISDKALAKDLMVAARSKVNSATDLDSYSKATEAFLRIYGDLTEGDKEKIKANLLYFKNLKDRAREQEAKRAIVEEQERILKHESNLAQQYYQHNLDKINAVKNVAEVFKPTVNALYSNVWSKRSVADPVEEPTQQEEEPVTT